MWRTEPQMYFGFCVDNRRGAIPGAVPALHGTDRPRPIPGYHRHTALGAEPADIRRGGRDRAHSPRNDRAPAGAPPACSGDTNRRAPGCADVPRALPRGSAPSHRGDRRTDSARATGHGDSNNAPWDVWSHDAGYRIRTVNPFQSLARCALRPHHARQLGHCSAIV